MSLWGNMGRWGRWGDWGAGLSTPHVRSESRGDVQGQATVTGVGGALAQGVGGAAGVTTLSGVGDALVLYASDALSGRPVPSNATQWAAFIARHSLSLAVPNYLHLCQEPGGDLADAIGALTLTASGTVQYSKPATGWSRVGVGGNGVIGEFTHAVGPTPSTTSIARFYWIAIDIGSGADFAIRSAGANGTNINNWGLGVLRTSGVEAFRIRGPGGQLDTSALSVYESVHPILVVNDIANTRLRFYSGQEKLSPTYGVASATTRYGIGGVGGSTFGPITVLYECGWSGAGAEISDANAKAFIESMKGTSVPWS